MYEYDLKEIKGRFTNTVYQRGLRYFQDGRVGDLFHDPVRQIWSAKVKGSKSYIVEILKDDERFSYDCNCPAFDQYVQCKHIAAVLLKIYEQEHSSFSKKNTTNHNELHRKQLELLKQRQQELERQRVEREAIYRKQLTNDFIQSIAKLSHKPTLIGEKKSKNIIMVEWILKIKRSNYTSQFLLEIEMKVGPKRTYVVKKLKDFLRDIENKAQYRFTANYTYDPTEQEFSNNDLEIITILQEAVNYEKLFNQFHSSSFNERSIIIPPMVADMLLEKINDSTFHFEIGGDAFNHLVFHQNELPFSIQLDKGRITDEFQLDMAEYFDCTYLDLYRYIIQENFFYKITPDQQVFMTELKRLVNQTGSAVIPIAKDQMDSFISQAAPVMGKVAKLEVTDKVSSRLVKFPLQAKVFVDLVQEELHVNLEFHYGEHQLDPFKPFVQEPGAPIIVRDTEKETIIINQIESTSLEFSEKGLYVKEEEGIVEFVYETIPRIEEVADVFLTNSVKSLLLPGQNAPVTNIEVHSSGNWLEIDFNMEGIQQQEIQQVLQSIVEKKKYYRLPSGAFVHLESEEFQNIQQIMSEFQIKPQQLQEETFTLPVYRGIQLNEMMESDMGGRVKYGKQFRRLLNRLKNPEELDFEVPSTLKAELRDYQYEGFQWLKALSTYKLGGILADEMGLGKTLQGIAFILSQLIENKDLKPALVVAPASLVYNWKNEFQKFAPTLTVEVLIGSPQERIEKLQSDELPNVWITSYPTLRQDIDYYEQISFSTLILDEAQTIKNYASKTAKSVREIGAETRFALSGTPIENSVDELWSIFQTIMPHFFPAQKAFRQLEPEKISRMIRPFLLRRMKKDVLTELPDKIETVNYSELTKDQKELYVAYLEKIQNETRETLQKDGFQKSQIKILAGLTRLRQLCCHPGLFLENYHGDSGKLEQLMEIVSNAVENGRRMLIFSQFTSMLAIIREKLTESGVPFFYLDGQTAPKDRVDMVEKFNEGNRDVFLISLKAGNTGLNLTGADTVLLYDLWWNPAVEEQAAGRAHRMGQKKVVQVIRLITHGTIEEKIYELQQSKKELIETVLEPGDQTISKMTEQELREILSI